MKAYNFGPDDAKPFLCDVWEQAQPEGNINPMLKGNFKVEYPM